MKRPEILLVNPWIHDFAAYDLWARPLGLLVLATRLRRLGWEPRVVNCLDPDHPDMKPVRSRLHGHGRFHRTPIPKPDVLQRIPRTYCRYGVSPDLVRRDLESIPNPEAILVTGIMTYWYPGVRETIQLLREVFPGKPILLGGVYPSLLPDHAGSVGADDVISGPVESVLAEILFRKTGLLSREVPPGPEFLPALDLMRKVRFLPLLTSRGCPFRCVYCASDLISPPFVRRTPAQVVDEIRATVDRYGISDIALYDDAFLVNAQSHALPILESVIDEIPGLRWHCPNGLHGSAITRKVASAMKRAGFETIRIGLESSSDEFHSRTGGKTNIRGFVAAVENLKEAGFSRKQIGVYLLVGMPGQSRTTIEADVERVLAAGAHPKLAEYSPIPGTTMWPQALERSRYPIDTEPLFHNCTLLPVAEPDVDPEFLQLTRKRISNVYTGSRKLCRIFS
ncbi:MAG TPA: radical SAM protein [Desulfomonilaceae bacterium]|nr:radical SAM protein [Desulfomonilaceae bacterium]